MLNSNVKKSKTQRLRDWFYPESQISGMTLLDGTVTFYAQIRSLIQPEHTLLDIGCGRGHYSEDENPFRKKMRIFKGDVKRVIGIDVGPAGKDNPHLDEFHMIDSDRWAVDDASVDIAISDYVLEHIEHPDQFFSEVQRVLKPGGYFFARTAHSWGYVSLIARMIPNRVHANVVSGAQDSRKEEDVFPTFYRCNTCSKLSKLLDQSGLDGVVITNSSEPSYLGFSSIAYWLGVLHQKLSPRFLHVGLIAMARKRQV